MAKWSSFLSTPDMKIKANTEWCILVMLIFIPVVFRRIPNEGTLLRKHACVDYSRGLGFSPVCCIYHVLCLCVASKFGFAIPDLLIQMSWFSWNVRLGWWVVLFVFIQTQTRQLGPFHRQWPLNDKHPPPSGVQLSAAWPWQRLFRWVFAWLYAERWYHSLWCSVHDLWACLQAHVIHS